MIEIKYPTWIDNEVMVHKESNQWSMCIDFINLDAVCLKYLYPL